MRYLEIASKATFKLKFGPGKLRGVLVTNAGSSWTLQVFDNTTAAAPAIAGTSAFTVAAAGTFYNFGDCGFSTGLTVVSGGSTAGAATIFFE